MRALLFFNERARRAPGTLETLLEALGRRGVETIPFVPGAPPPLPLDAAIVAGGDGTVISAVSVALDAAVPLGIVPLGTFNDLARTFDIPLALDAACEVIAHGHTRTIDLGRVNGVYFVNEASVGLSTRVARRHTPDLKRRFGVLGLAALTLRAFAESEPFSVELVHDGETESFKTIQLTVANNGHFGGVVTVGGAAIDDGRLDLFSVEVENWLGVVPLLPKLVSGDGRSVRGLRARRSTRFTVRTHRPHHVSADGEPAGFTPATFDILPGALRVIVAHPVGE